MLKRLLVIIHLLSLCTAVSPNWAQADELPVDGFVPVMIPFTACQDESVVSTSRWVRPLSPEQIQAYRETIKGFPVQFVQPVGLFLFGHSQDQELLQARKDLSQLALQGAVDLIARNEKLTRSIVNKCLAPVADKDQWPTEFPKTCRMDEKREVYPRYLASFPAALLSFRVYLAMATGDPQSSRSRLWDFDWQVNRSLRRLSLTSLPDEREPLDDYELPQAKKAFNEAWIENLKDLLAEQSEVLKNLGETSSTARSTVQARVDNLTQALAFADQNPDHAVYLALTYADADWQEMAAQAWRRQRYKFLNLALTALDESRVVGLLKRRHAQVAEVEAAYAQIHGFQEQERLKYQALLDRGVPATDDILFKYPGLIEMALSKRPDLCGPAAVMFYQYANANLRNQALMFAGMFGVGALAVSSSSVSAPVVMGLAVLYSMWDILQSDWQFEADWHTYQAYNYGMVALSTKADLLSAMDRRQAAARGLLLVAAGVKMPKRWLGFKNPTGLEEIGRMQRSFSDLKTP